MSRRKLNAFTADDAGDSFTPTVKTVKGADVAAEEVSPKQGVEKKKVSGKKGKKPKVEHEPKPKSKPKPKPKSKPEVKHKTVDEKPIQKETEAHVKKKEQVKPEAQKDMRSAEIHRESQEHEQGSEEIVQLVGFVLGNEEYGVDIQKVQEINRILEITRVPRTPEFVMGVINLRGNVIPVINLRERFGLPLKDNDKDVRIIVVEVQTKIIGIMVDAVSEVLRIPASTIEPPPDIVTGVDTKYIQGVGKLQDRLLIMLDLDKILSHAQVGKLEEIA